MYSLQRKTGKSILNYGLPLLAGLAITHAFIPPTPGLLPWLKFFPQIWGGSFFLDSLWDSHDYSEWANFYPLHQCENSCSGSTVRRNEVETKQAVRLQEVFLVVGLPLVLIVLTTLMNSLGGDQYLPPAVVYAFQLLGHPFGALLLANLVAWFLLGRRHGVSSKALQQIANRSMAPAGMIILLTGAGGTFKQMLITTAAGKMIAEAIANQGIPLLLFAFLAAVVIRLLQGSATVAMITAAGLTAPLVGLIGQPHKKPCWF